MTNLIGNIKKGLLFLLFFAANQALAAQIPIYATSCETIRGTERKTNVISRAADKATFSAISNLEDLFFAKEELSQSDFSTLVYSIIDNNVSDLKIQTTTSNDLEVCVEINGYANLEEANIPKQNEAQNLLPKTALKKDKPFVFIDQTQFFNDTKSNAVSKEIANYFNDSKSFYLTDKVILADFVITPKVLKSKIDPINSSTNRFHMVISLDLEDLNTQQTTKEHQTKFILIEANDDEQAKAQELMLKLFKNASTNIISKLETLSNKNQDFLQAQ